MRHENIMVLVHPLPGHRFCLVYLECRRFILLFLTTNVVDRDRKLKFVGTYAKAIFLTFNSSGSYFFQYCDRGSIAPIEFICYRTSDFTVFCPIYNGTSNHVPQRETEGNGTTGALFLKGSILDGDFIKSFCQLATNLSTSE
jgi:hypothetical protein